MLLFNAIIKRLARTGRFLWSGWSGVAALCLLAAVWQFGHEIYGNFILPSPLATINQVIVILTNHDTWAITLLTAQRAITGFILASLAGSLIGLAAGYFPAVLRLTRPLVTVLLGVPPIAWIVLAMIWFGSTNGTVIVTILVAAIPIVFVSVAEGVMARNRGLDDMARVFGASHYQRLFTLSFRQVAAHLFPALVLCLGLAFKVAVMAELLANVGGIGGELARSRANLDVVGAMAWILIAVAALITIEYGVIHPVRAELERWRIAAQPWGVKR